MFRLNPAFSSGISRNRHVHQLRYHQSALNPIESQLLIKLINVPMDFPYSFPSSSQGFPTFFHHFPIVFRCFPRLQLRPEVRRSKRNSPPRPSWPGSERCATRGSRCPCRSDPGDPWGSMGSIEFCCCFANGLLVKNDEKWPSIDVFWWFTMIDLWKMVKSCEIYENIGDL